MNFQESQAGLARYLPIMGWLPKYPRNWLRADLMAGLIASAVVIPQAMAYAAIAGLPVQVGLYTALVPMLVYTLLGTSRPLSVSTTSTISMLVAAEVVLVASAGDPSDAIAAASTLALLTGAFLLLAGFLRLGFLANFISDPVLAGFKAGIGIVIFVSQLGKVLGIAVEKAPFFRTILNILKSLGAINWLTFSVALGTLAILLILPRFFPRLPAALVAVGAGIAVSALLGLEARGVELVGEIPAGLPSFAMPNLSLVSRLWPGALGIALMSFTESIAAARAFAGHEDPPVNANQELVALGTANLAGSFFRAFPAGGGTSQTAVNAQAGAKSQLSEIVTALVVALTLLLLAPLIGLMPQAALGALVLVAAVGLIKPAEFRAIQSIRRMELIWAFVAALGVVLLGTLQGILLAVTVSLLTLLYYANHPPVYALGRKPGTDIYRPLGDHPEDETFPGLLILRTESRLTFANAPRVGEKFREMMKHEIPRVLLFDCSAIPDIEYTALVRLTAAEEKLRQAGVSLWIAALNPEPLKVIQRAPLGKILGEERLFHNVEEAVEAYLHLEE